MAANTIAAHRSPAPPAREEAVIGRDDKAAVVHAAPQADPGHAVTQDRADFAQAKPQLLDYLRHAQSRSGRSPLELVREYFRLNRGPGKLTLQEYVQFGVYDTNRYGPEDQARFLTNRLHWPITRICCDMTWQATTEDKWLCSHILAGTGIRVPETLAVIDTTERHYPGTRKITTAAEFRDFARSEENAPFFGKVNREICSFGAFLAEGSDEKAIRLKGHDPLSHEAFMERFVDETPYLLQRLERNHGFFDDFSDSLATIRVCILVDETEIRIPFAVLKLPSRDNIADSFWRPGNLACKVDVGTGEILVARSKDTLGTTDYTTHPETGAPLVGKVVPTWEGVLDLARRCAPIFRPLRYQSMDIAVTSEGPVLIEINTGGGFDLPQLASGEGFLTDEVREFFRACGYRKV